MKIEALKRACELLGSQAALARALGVKPPTVKAWIDEKRPVPARLCVAIEQVTRGAVTRQELHPNDWQSLWPELAQAA